MLSIPISINDAEKNQIVETLGLIDSGAGGKFIDQNYVKSIGLKTQLLDEPMIARNVDGTENKRGRITSFVELDLTINGRTINTTLLITGLGKQKIILGFPWLNEHNPDIDWKTGKFTWQTANRGQRRPLKIKRYHAKEHPLKPLESARRLARIALGPRRPLPKPTITEEPDQEEKLNRTQNPTTDNEILLAYIEEVRKPNEIWINAKTTSAIEFHLKHDEKKDDLPLEQRVPKEYHEYLDVFDENKADRFPGSRSWDHKIELKEGFQPKSFKILPQKNKRNWISGLKKTWKKDIFDLHNPLWHPHFSTSKRKMENSDLARIIDT